MKTYLLTNNIEKEAIFSGSMIDTSWDRRDSKTIKIETTYADAIALFVDDLVWSIKCVYEVSDVPEGEPIPEPEIFDNSEYCLCGSITDNRDGTFDCKMGKPTELETLIETIYGGVNE